MGTISQILFGFVAAIVSGTQRAIFGYGMGPGTPPFFHRVAVSITNLVSNTGVVATDTAGVGTARERLAAAGYSLT